MIAILSLLLYRYYAVLQEKLCEISPKNFNIKQLDDLCRIQMLLSQLVQSAANVFSPLILIVFGCNVCYILAFLYSGLMTDITNPNIIVRTTFAFSFSYVVSRFVFSALLSARIPEMVLYQLYYAF